MGPCVSQSSTQMNKSNNHLACVRWSKAEAITAAPFSPSFRLSLKVQVKTAAASTDPSASAEGFL